MSILMLHHRLGAAVSFGLSFRPTDIELFASPAPGHLEAIATIENIMEHIARKVGKDPLEVRLHNLEDGSELKKIIPDFVKSVGE